MKPIVIAGASGLSSSIIEYYRAPIEDMINELKDRLPIAHAKAFIWNEQDEAFDWINSFGPDAKIFLFGHSNGVYFALKLAERFAPRTVTYVGALDKHIDTLTVNSPPIGNNVENLTDLHAALDWVTVPDGYPGNYYKHDFQTTHGGILYEKKATGRIIDDIIRLAGTQEEQPPVTGNKFDHWTPIFMQRLMADFDLEMEDAAAVFGNAGHESAGYETLQEISPVAGRGGWGIMQWTADRRREFEAYCDRHGYDKSDMDVNYKWLFVELRTTAEGKALDALKSAKGLEAKTKAFCDAFLRPGVKAYASRYKWAQRAVEAWNASLVPTVPETPPLPLPADLEAWLAERYPQSTPEERYRAGMLADALAYRLGTSPATEPGSFLSKLGEIDMGNYSKLIGSLVGGVMGILVTKSIIPADLNTPEIQAAVTVLASAFFTFIFPANKAA